jgi:hypothetical protein
MARLTDQRNDVDTDTALMHAWIKPPGDGHTVKEYLWDYWNLANYTKDAIDLFLQEGLPIVKAAAVQLLHT